MVALKAWSLVARANQQTMTGAATPHGRHTAIKARTTHGGAQCRPRAHTHTTHAAHKSTAPTWRAAQRATHISSGLPIYLQAGMSATRADAHTCLPAALPFGKH